MSDTHKDNIPRGIIKMRNDTWQQEDALQEAQDSPVTDEGTLYVADDQLEDLQRLREQIPEIRKQLKTIEYLALNVYAFKK